jgi:hypothetical protein
MARGTGKWVAGFLPRGSLLAAWTLAAALHLAVLCVLNVDAAPLPATAGLVGNASAVSVRVLPALREGATPPSRPPRASALPLPPDHRLARAEGPAIPAPAPPNEGVQLVPHPRSAPDLEQLQGLAFSGLPMRIRLLIDDHGRVTDAKALETSEADDVTAAVLRVFEETAFVPARRNGVDVTSVLEIELSFGS